ncbi:EAL and HDOD domain-containing protein [Robbsia andropogonis]|uniref:EAL and HDOD domain-containing protein n=1 Tax=Robbsia andropogonis TaxID=28092 RepID=UPI000464B9D2|nr:EAL domain-containing protein [Robbsia andropogonis]MCP1117320.1 EAL domain-containing protein [Robbsia andropogonis]MCP1129285.1 EAL domain-containing protein [Robbsia andropogonis]
MSPDTVTLPQDTRTSALLGRQPIVGRDGAIAGYELLFRGGEGNHAVIVDDAVATQRVILNVVSEFGVNEVMGKHRGFINVGRESLTNDALQMLDPQRFTLEILETVHFDAEIVQRVRTLRHAGFQIALDDITDLSQLPADGLQFVDVLKIDMLHTRPAALPGLVAAAKRARCKILAEKVETRESFEEMLALGVDLFQGYFFARPQVLKQRCASASQSALLRLLNTLAGEPSAAELEAAVKRSPLLLKQLMTLASSAATRGHTPGTVRQAIMRVGTRRLARWAQLLLYGEASNMSPQDNPLVQTVSARARFMELAAQELDPFDDVFSDNAYQVGLFSLMHIVTGQTCAQLMAQLSLARPVQEAILHDKGQLGDLLRLAEALEGIPGSDIEDNPLRVLLPDTTITSLYASAIAYSNESLQA